MNDLNAAPLMVLLGTRPEAIKLCPLLLALTAARLPVVAVNTGQHAHLVEPVLEHFGCRVDEALQLAHPHQTPLSLCERLLQQLPPLFARYRPAMVAVHGDTVTAFAGALAAYLCGIPVCHVEAGLRTGDHRAPCPEEAFRVAIDGMTTLALAPTPAAAEQLRREGHTAARIALTGNTAIDALYHALAGTWRLSDSLRACRTLDGRPLSAGVLEGRRLLLLTLHRRETDEATMRSLLRSIRGVVEERQDVRLLFALHPSERVRRVAREELGACGGVLLCEAIPFPHAGRLLSAATLLLTDSGGLQEEATALGIPTLVLREDTERPEGVAAGVLRCVGTDGGRVAGELARLLDDAQQRARMAHPDAVFGDGRAAERMVEALREAGVFSCSK